MLHTNFLVSAPQLELMQLKKLNPWERLPSQRSETVNDVVTEIRNFHSLKELSENLEEEISFCKAVGEEYGERLGSLLRENETTHGEEDWFKELSGLQKTGKETKSKGKSNGNGKGKGKKKGAKAGWIQFKDIMISTEEYGEAQILFDAIEDIKSRVNQLEKIKENIEDLKRLGLGENIVYITYLHEGVPEKIVLIKKNGEEFGKKFEFVATFSLPEPRE
jgi:predicted small metal-binding protein